MTKSNPSEFAKVKPEIERELRRAWANRRNRDNAEFENIPLREEGVELKVYIDFEPTMIDEDDKPMSNTSWGKSGR